MNSQDSGLDFATRDNIEKARNGREFEKRLAGNILEPLKSKGVIDDFKFQPVYAGCFNPDFEVRKGNKIVVVDTTTTARTDRIKGKQWNAYHAKRILRSQPSLKKGKKEITAYVVVRSTRDREKASFLRAKKNIAKCSYDSVDDVLSVEEFDKLLADL